CVRILFAIESGSRAWGFPSRDSDYDVRFVYARPLDWYLSVYEGRDVIECPVDGLLDLNGWDLKKALDLLRRSNPALMEWLSSPLRYLATPAGDPFAPLAERPFPPVAACPPYPSTVREHVNRAAGPDRVRLKRYLYTLRPLLAARWVVEHGTQPP